jgi:predicted MFS family arabinose efflux permease
VPESVGAASRERVDGAGAALATVGLAGIVFSLIEAPNHGWTDARVVAGLALGITALAAFAFVEARVHSPMLPLGLFRRRDFSGANLLTLLLYAALGGSLYFFPLNLIQVQGYGATMAGAALLPFIAIMFSLSRWAGKLVDRFGSRPPLVVGPSIAAVAFACFAAPSVGVNYWTSFFPAVCLLGLGMTITVAPLTTTVMNAVQPDMAGTASGVNNAVSRAAALLAIAVFGIILAAAFDATLVAELRRLQVPPDLASALIAQRHKLAGITVPEGIPSDMAAALRHAIGTSFVAGFRWVMLVCSGLALLGALAAWWIIEPRETREPLESLEREAESK